MLEGLLGLTSKEKKLQFYIHPDDSMEFRRLTVDDTVLKIFKKGKAVAAFKHYFKLEYDFNGYKNIPNGKVSLGYSRDVILDLFNTLDEKDKFTKGTNLDRPWITEIGANTFYKAKNPKPASILMDKFSTICLILVAAEAAGIVLRVAF